MWYTRHGVEATEVASAGFAERELDMIERS
jgi:hypothetical protein